VTDDEDDGFQFGTSGELAGKAEAKKLEQLDAEGLMNPALFQDQDEREKRYLSHLFEIRQNSLSKCAN